MAEKCQDRLDTILNGMLMTHGCWESAFQNHLAVLKNKGIIQQSKRLYYRRRSGVRHLGQYTRRFKIAYQGIGKQRNAISCAVGARLQYTGPFYGRWRKTCSVC